MVKHDSKIAYVSAVALVTAITLFGCHSRSILTEIDFIMLYLVGTVTAAALLGYGPSIIYSFLSVSAFNYFFVEPLGTFHVHNPSYWLTFAVMFLACLVIASLASRLRDQLLLSQRREMEAVTLYTLTKELGTSSDRIFMANAFIRHVAKITDAPIRIRPAGEAAIGAAGFAACKNIEIKGSTGTLGAIELGAAEDAAESLPILETCANLLGSAWERVLTAVAAEDARIQAETEKTRNILLRSMSHDLRTPLAAVAGAADMLLRRSPEDPLVGSIKKQTYRLTKIISNLIEVTRIENGKIKLNLQPYDPAEIIGSAVAESAEALRHHDLRLTVEPGMPFVRMDGLLITQLLQNLLENAAHHTPLGTPVELRAYMREDSLCIVVSDKGPGFPAGKEMQIFERFVSFTANAGDRPRGLGLGLAICQSIVATHKGVIYAQNSQDGGCRFTVEMPPDLTVRQRLELDDAA